MLPVLCYPVSAFGAIKPRIISILRVLDSYSRGLKMRFRGKFVAVMADRNVVKPDGIAVKADRIVGSCNGIVVICEELGLSRVGMRGMRIKLSGCSSEVSRKVEIARAPELHRAWSQIVKEFDRPNARCEGSMVSTDVWGGFRWTWLSMRPR